MGGACDLPSNLLILKLPAPKEEDLTRGILETIDMDSYRTEVRQAQSIMSPDEEAEIGSVSTPGGAAKPEPKFDRLSNIVKAFNEMWGDIDWTDRDRIERIIIEELPEKVAADSAYQNAMANSDRQNARIEHDQALRRAMQSFLADDTQLFKQYSDNEDFRRWLAETVFTETYAPESGVGERSRTLR
jgi:type I restriction enzyme, R subunit